MTAADLIRDYREIRPSKLPPDLAFLSFWHEGQMRADAGQARQAIALFARARKPAAEDAPFGWNLYVDGSVAFLHRNRAALQAARDRLAALSMPVGYAANVKGADGTPAKVKWPMNLSVLDGLLRCFDQDYRTAYACANPNFSPELSS